MKFLEFYYGVCVDIIVLKILSAVSLDFANKLQNYKINFVLVLTIGLRPYFLASVYDNTGL